jgi:hypothetical protein
MLINDAAAHKKQHESFPPEEKGKILETIAAAHMHNCDNLPSSEQKI